MDDPTQTCPNGQTPPFPGLYIPRGLDQGGLYICSAYHAWMFTLLWTLIIYAAFYLAAAGYAFLIQVGVGVGAGTTAAVKANGTETGTANGNGNGIMEKTESPSPTVTTTTIAGVNGLGVESLVKGARRNLRVTIVVGVAYIVVGGIEAVLAGSVVGVMLGTVYKAGEFRLSTWVPLVWAVINVVFLILSSFSIQERLL